MYLCMHVWGSEVLHFAPLTQCVGCCGVLLDVSHGYTNHSVAPCYAMPYLTLRCVTSSHAQSYQPNLVALVASRYLHKSRPRAWALVPVARRSRTWIRALGSSDPSHLGYRTDVVTTPWDAGLGSTREEDRSVSQRIYGREERERERAVCNRATTASTNFLIRGSFESLK